MFRFFISHAAANTREAIALKKWMIKQEPPLEQEIFLDVDPNSGMPLGKEWQDALREANEHCEAVICLLSKKWEKSSECRTEFPDCREPPQAMSL